MFHLFFFLFINTGILEFAHFFKIVSHLSKYFLSPFRHQIACRNIKKNLEDDDDETSSCSTSASADLSSDTDEIPVWVNNEQRYISGITQDTTCIDLVEALLEDECVQGKPEFASKSPKDYVITERWKKVEQVLDGRTNILKIWNAWGSAQQEVINLTF